MTDNKPPEQTTGDGPATPDAAAHPRGAITDSPWFWICMFACVGLMSVVVIEPKFRRREAQIESKFHMRQHVDRIRADGTPSDEATYEPDDTPLKTVHPIVWLLTGVVAISWGVLFWSRYLRPELASRKDIEVPDTNRDDN